MLNHTVLHSCNVSSKQLDADCSPTGTRSTRGTAHTSDKDGAIPYAGSAIKIIIGILYPDTIETNPYSLSLASRLSPNSKPSNTTLKLTYSFEKLLQSVDFS